MPDPRCVSKIPNVGWSAAVRQQSDNLALIASYLAGEAVEFVVVGGCARWLHLGAATKEVTTSSAWGVDVLAHTGATDIATSSEARADFGAGEKPAERSRLTPGGKVLDEE